MPFTKFEKLSIDTGEIQIACRRGGTGLPLLLLHGYPQTHFMWHLIADDLARHFTVIAADLRGYGDSDKPPSKADHSPYSKRAMANDMVRLMGILGFDSFFVAGHDRGGRVAHRMARDHPAAVARLAVLDIAPTLAMYAATNMDFATAYYHWFFLIQPAPIPERMIGADPGFYMSSKCGAWGRTEGAITEDAYAEYLRCFAHPDAIHASCEDYRAAATIDLEHDQAENGATIDMPFLALWGRESYVGTRYDVISEWQKVAKNVTGKAVSGGHYLAEEAPGETLEALLNFFGPV